MRGGVNRHFIQKHPERTFRFHGPAMRKRLGSLGIRRSDPIDPDALQSRELLPLPIKPADQPHHFRLLEDGRCRRKVEVDGKCARTCLGGTRCQHAGEQEED